MHDLSTLYSALLKLRYASLNIDWSQNAVLSRIIAAEMLRGRNYLLADNNLDSILYAVNNKVAMVKDIPALNLIIATMVMWKWSYSRHQQPRHYQLTNHYCR